MKDDPPPLEYESSGGSPFDKPVRRPVAGQQKQKRFSMRPKFRITYWIVCLTLIGLLIWYISSMFGSLESLSK